MRKKHKFDLAEGKTDDSVEGRTDDSGKSSLPQPPTRPLPPPLPPVPPPPPPSFADFKRRAKDHKDDPNQSSAKDEQYAMENEAALSDVSPHLLGSYGDPKLWAHSTLEHAKVEDLAVIHSVMPDMYTGSDSIRNRIWLHDLLDDKRIPYYIEVGGVGGGKALTEAQLIYVEKKNFGRALSLIEEFKNPGSIVREIMDINDFPKISDDGIPQKMCPSCGKEIDFDYVVCPFCKEHFD